MKINQCSGFRDQMSEKVMLRMSGFRAQNVGTTVEDVKFKHANKLLSAE